MKRLISFLLAIILLVLPLSTLTGAVQETADTEYFEDGSYIIEGIDNFSGVTEESAQNFIARIISLIKRIISLIFKTGSDTAAKTKYVNYYDKNGTLLWTVYLTGKFTFDGNSAVCTSADIYCIIYDRDWDEVFTTVEKKSSKAIGSFKIRQEKLGVLLKSIERTIVLKCDKKGNIS